MCSLFLLVLVTVVRNETISDVPLVLPVLVTVERLASLVLISALPPSHHTSVSVPLSRAPHLRARLCSFFSSPLGLYPRTRVVLLLQRPLWSFFSMFRPLRSFFLMSAVPGVARQLP